MKKEKKPSKKQTLPKKFGIRSKLLVSILPIAIFAFILVIAIAYISSKATLKDQTKSIFESQGNTCASTVTNWKNSILEDLDAAVNMMQNLKMNEESILNYEINYYRVYSDYPNGVYVCTAGGDVYDLSNTVSTDNLTEQTFYVEGLEHETMQFGTPYKDEASGSVISTVSRHSDNINGSEAVVCADIHLDTLYKRVSEIDMQYEGDAFILDADSGTILAHCNQELSGMTVSDIQDPFYSTLLANITAGKTNVDSIHSVDGQYLLTIQNIEGTNWYIVLRALESNVYARVNTLGITLIIVGFFMIAIIAGALIYVIGRITKPIQGLNKSIAAVTAGDFTTQVKVSGNDEVSIMAGSLNRFMEVMRQTLGSIRLISSEIDTQANTSNEISGDLHSSASGQAEAMTRLKDNLDDLIQSIQVIAENATNLACVVSDTNEAGLQAINYITTTMNEADTGKQNMLSITDSMNDMREGMETLEQSITDVGAAAVKINEISSTIRSIADETNLLALNASIEAARAGEAGRGFTVVATQIKKLAENSGEAADDITKLISSVTDQINSTVTRSHNSMEQINNNTEKVSMASSQFNTIFESIQNTNEIVRNIISKIHDANDVASNMAAITEEQSASASEIEATATNIQELANLVSTNSANVKTDSDHLAETATDLKSKISEFKI